MYNRIWRIFIFNLTFNSKIFYVFNNECKTWRPGISFKTMLDVMNMFDISAYFSKVRQLRDSRAITQARCRTDKEFPTAGYCHNHQGKQCQAQAHKGHSASSIKRLLQPNWFIILGMLFSTVYTRRPT